MKDARCRQPEIFKQDGELLIDGQCFDLPEPSVLHRRSLVCEPVFPFTGVGNHRTEGGRHMFLWLHPLNLVNVSAIRLRERHGLTIHSTGLVVVGSENLVRPVTITSTVSARSVSTT